MNEQMPAYGYVVLAALFIGLLLLFGVDSLDDLELIATVGACAMVPLVFLSYAVNVLSMFKRSDDTKKEDL